MQRLEQGRLGNQRLAGARRAQTSTPCSAVNQASRRFLLHRIGRVGERVEIERRNLVAGFGRVNERSFVQAIIEPTLPMGSHYTEPLMFCPTLLLLILAADGKPRSSINQSFFNTPEADAIVSAMQVFPADNPWNADVSNWPVHPNSKPSSPPSARTSRSATTPTWASSSSPRPEEVDVKLVRYPDESDKGPYPAAGQRAHRGLAR